jgi:lactoylglutathione lyase
MFSHIFIGVGDFARALAFYTPLMQALGVEQRFCEMDRPWAGWQTAPGKRPFLVIAPPFDGQAHVPGNGQMTAFLASSRAQVQAVYALALAQGARCEGPPGLRPEYHADYYGAYFRDTEGNKLCVACHEPVEG